MFCLPRNTLQQKSSLRRKSSSPQEATAIFSPGTVDWVLMRTALEARWTTSCMMSYGEVTLPPPQRSPETRPRHLLRKSGGSGRWDHCSLFPGNRVPLFLFDLGNFFCPCLAFSSGQSPEVCFLGIKRDEREIISENMKSLEKTLRGGHNLENTWVKEAENLMQGQKNERKRIN